MLVSFVAKKRIAILSLALSACVGFLPSTVLAQPTHALSMHGEPALPADFDHFPYVNPDAPKGGSITYGVIGTFDSLNPFVLKSMRTTARGLFADGDYGNLVFETLMQRSRDEPFSLYGLIAEKVEIDPESRWIEFTLNPLAKWSDGEPITSDDVIFTYDILTEKGRPPYNNRMSRIDSIEKTGERSVRFNFNETSDREFPLIIASAMPVLPKHAIDPQTFGNASLKAPIGSGPYRPVIIEPGARIVYERNPDYWAKDLPSKRGFDNFDRIVVEYFRNETALFEAFKKGLIDVYPEGNPTRWQKQFNFPAVSEGKVIKDSFVRGVPVNFLGFALNTRRDIFADRQVRHALSLLFDFELINRTLFDGQFKRTAGYWDGSELSSVGTPASAQEKSLLAPYKDEIRPDVMAGEWRPNTTDGRGTDRAPIKEAYEILKNAGFTFDQGIAYQPNGEVFSFEIMTRSIEEEKIALAFQRTLKKLGIIANVRTVDDAQYQQRMQTFDYDIIFGALSGTISPGIEQWNRWGSASRDAQGSFNYAGVSSEAADAMIEAMLSARTNEDFTAAVRAMDRVLISGDYYIPLYHIPEQWVARWSHIKRPDVTPLYGYQLPTWWRE